LGAGEPKKLRFVESRGLAVAQVSEGKTAADRLSPLRRVGKEEQKAPKVLKSVCYALFLCQTSTGERALVLLHLGVGKGWDRLNNGG